VVPLKISRQIRTTSARGNLPSCRAIRRRRIVASRRLLERADRVDDCGPAHQEIVHLVVDLVDLAAQVVQGPVRVGHGGKKVSGRA
jgi:hypothetical protein